MPSSTMRALAFDGPAPDMSTTRLAQLPVPVPGPGEIAIDVHHAGVNFIDIMARRGDPGYAAQWPFVPGLEVAGTVRALGPDVDGPPVGTRVAAFSGRSGLAEVAIVAAPLVVPVPDAVSFAQAAAAPGTLTAAELLVADTARVRAGDVVLVHAAGGGVGPARAPRARLAGASTLIGTVGHPRRAAAAQGAGYDVVLARGPELTVDIRKRTGGRGVDVVLDPQGTDLLDVDLEVVAPGGRIVLFGNATGAPLAPLPATRRLYAANASIAGFSLTRWSAVAPQRVADALKRVLADLASGAHTAEVTEIDDLDGAADAQQALADGRGAGKQVVRIR
jgi:NADPH2:quinone reductase